MDTFIQHKTENKSRNENDSYRVAIIGCGPKGLYGFERLIAHLKANPSNKKVEIHLFNKTPNFGSGEIWNPSQPDFLMVNFCIGNINMWTDETPRSAAKQTLSLTDWLRRKNPDTDELDFVSRGIVGEYLDDGFAQIMRNLPENVSVEKYCGEVFDIEKMGNEFEIFIRTKNKKHKIEAKFQNILLTTGHSSRHDSERESNYKNFTENSPETSFISFVYPVENLKDIPANSSVAIKGMGLTFVDAVLALTEGRGGKFELSKDNEIVSYKPSGKEPKAIYPFSRSSLPILTRGAKFGKANFDLIFFTKENINKLRKKSVDGKLDFSKDLWNLVKQEMIYAYYRVLMKNKGFAFKTATEFADFKHEIKFFHKEFKNEKQFNLEQFLNPLNSNKYQTENHQKFIEDYIKTAITEAKLGEDKSPFAAVVAIWREITPIFGKVFEFGGLTAQSNRDFLENYFGNLCRITFGPPIKSMEKILAIANAGLLKFEIGAEPIVILNNDSRQFKISSKQTDFECEVKHLIDARIPKKKIPNNASQLYKNLLKKGLIDIFKNEDFEVGCLKLSRKGKVFDTNGNLQSNFVAYGTPTEGITFDNDSLSRSRNNFVSFWAKEISEKILQKSNK